jgi:prephenate dehydratase
MEDSSLMAEIIAFQGEHGAYSEEAVLALYPQAQPQPCRSLSDVFTAVARGIATAGVVAVENSQAGSINETYDLLLQHTLIIVGETIVEVNHCLLALPGQSLTDITRVYSHPQALAQCADYLRTLGVEVIPTYDTAGSARMIVDQGLRHCAAVASERSATIYGLTVLARRIQTNPANYTRFLAIAREAVPFTGPSKTSIIFAVRNQPGALYTALGCFATRGINLTKLESRPSKNEPWQYIFYVDFEGHVDDPPCRAALGDLLFHTSFLKILGSYPSSVTPNSVSR